MSPEEKKELVDAIRGAKPQWRALLETVGAAIALFVSLWLGASYLFVTEARATAEHMRIEKETDERFDAMLQGINALVTHEAKQDTQIEEHQRRLDARRGTR